MTTKILFLLILLISAVATAKPRIITSITPLSSIVAMLVQDQAEVSSVITSNLCPHHYHLKPSDLGRMQDAELIIYINEQFDSFIAKFLNNHPKASIKISDFKSLKLINNQYSTNWHFWLDLENVRVVLEELAPALVKQFPQIADQIAENLGKSLKQIADLTAIKAKDLADLPRIILLSDSLEYFFVEHLKLDKLYQTDHKSLKYISILDKLLAASKDAYLVLSTDQDQKLYQKFNRTIIHLDSENWPASSDNINHLFYQQYLKMIKQVAQRQ